MSACAAHGPAQRADVPAEAQRTLSVGFRQISERYVEYLPAGRLAFEGIRGLARIDPDFEATRGGDTVVFGIGDRPRHIVKAPDNTDADGWASLALDAVGIAQKESPSISAAPMDRIYEAIFDGSLSLLDAYSRYSGAEEANRNREKRSGFGGIGIIVKPVPRGASIVQVLFDSPAIQAGLAEGDLITHIDSQPVVGLAHPSDVARGPIGSSVVLRVERRDGTTVDVDLKRQRIVMSTVDVSVRDNIVTARITGFNRNTTHQLAMQASDAIRSLDGAARGLILDLRGNPGGLLSEAVRVADLFIPEGRILSTRGRHPASLHEYEASGDDIGLGLPIVILINGRSASASEIVAAALQDHDRAIVVGSSSYGKGTVQMIIPLPNDGELTVTWSKFVTPSGYVLNGLGVHPSVCTSLPTATADQLIGRAVDSGAELLHVFQEWRGIDRHPELERKSLRALCPASDTADGMDSLIAENLIGDARLYQRVLSFAPTVLAAQK